MPTAPVFRSPRPDLLALLNAAKAEPDDDTPRLVLADWLQEQPDPADVARGEWLRTLVEKDRLPGEDPRREDLFRCSLELWRSHRETWAGPLDQIGMRFRESEYTFSRGLLYPCAAASTAVSAQGAAIAESEVYAWVGGLVFEDPRYGQLARLVESPLADSLISLHFAAPADLGPGDFDVLASRHPLPALRSLSTFDLPIRQAGARSLAGSPWLRNLRRLSLHYSEVGDAGFAELCGSSCLNDLRLLDVSHGRLSIHSARSFADSDRLPSLTALELGGNRVGPDGMLILVAYPPADRLTCLGLRANGVADYGVEALCRQPHVNRLASLDLTSNLLTNRAAVALGAADHMKSLDVLTLRQNGIGEEGARALAGSPNLGSLRVLDLRENPIGQKGADALRERFGERVLLG